MKRLLLLFASAAAMFLAACSSEFDDTEIWNSINSLEQRMSAMETVMNAYENDLHIKSVNQIEGGYVITFSDGSQATIMDGKDGEDGKDGDTYIESIIIGENEVTFVLTDGQKFSIPLYSTLSINFDSEDLVVMAANSTRDLHYTVESILTDIKVEVISSPDIKAKVIPATATEGIIQIITGDIVDEYSKVVVFVSNGEKVIMRSITFEEPGLEISDNSEKIVQSDGGTITLEFLTNDDINVSIEPEAQSWITLLKSRALTGHHISLIISPNEDAPRSGKINIKSVIDPNICVEYIIKQDAGKSYVKRFNALRALYDATDGPNWRRSDNWFTDKPFDEWYGLNDNKPFEEFRIVLGSNKLRGTIPVAFADLMDDATYIDLHGNHLYGKIPAEIKEHPKWQRFGWNILKQDPTEEGGFDFSDGTGLVLPDGEIDFFVDNTSKNLQSVLKENNLTLVINVGYVNEFRGISEKMVNYFLDYHNKGLGLIATVADTWDTSYDECRNYVLEKLELGLPADIMWAKSFVEDITHQNITSTGNMGLYDSSGNLIACWLRVYQASGSDSFLETLYLPQIDAFVRARLGEPEEHPEYEEKMIYTSTDYSKDGEVVTLQQATKGKGIDLVFMGDAYVDKHMDTNGKYEQDMRASMEYFFEAEPYKSFRDRFNVYAVKVVSPNYEFKSNSKHRINFDDSICFEYASKINGIDLDKVTIVNVVNRPDMFFASGHANLYTSGASVAHIENGGPSSIIVHEAGGHGFAKLLDEYIYEAYENNIIPDDEVEEFNTWIKTTYHDLGWGANVDTTNDPDKILWSHFLNDSRYSDEVGIYQGAWYYPFNLWRPSENSIMNDMGNEFNAPSREAIYKAVMSLSEGESWVYDYEEFVRFDKSVSTRSAQHTEITGDKQIKRKEHKAPTIIKGSWRDAK